ncbi:kinetochore protein NDC80 homolog isoform X1 [Poecilia latipinna]|uniref:kinetochore protein NDC80 homolog isoform X1 n=1 Tax=Poecilia formosa TaxID=48698 RepID=UPI0004441479|nr:PREDICTED: kinetochore protein NDC80 homolog isoform X1 [Poecilia formosa]XP_014849756.1 PREDICTED: kinetochore protein NDC80 homolog isoform X1 [Poecilia mexicana]XP_014897724.1 PREDICTED: kinetochore protein NDC80 homolog isoform X1 [Poecilia latipinna]
MFGPRRTPYSGRKSRAGSRPSDMPMRVQDSNRMSMVYTTPQSKLPSFGKLSMSKPPSGTSERRTSFFGPRTSGASMPRNSTMAGFGGTEKIKDSRPLHDKSFVQQCIRQLHEFLTEQGYPGTLSAKTLQSPSTKEFVKMFEFIYRQLDPTFEMPNSKVEEEVPALLKALRYPFVLSKCSMYSVGAPHTWPQALGALMWLIDNVKINWSLSKQELLLSDFCEDTANIEEGAEYNKLFLDYMAETYSKFMHGEDVFEEEDEAFLTKLKRLYNVDEALLESMEEKHRFLSKELERLEKESQTDRLMTKRMEKVKLQADLKKLQSYRSKLETFTASLENKFSELTDELENTVSHLETLKHERNELQHLLQNQKFTPADVERINREKRELQQTIASLTKSLEDAEQHRWNEEIALAKVKETLDLKVAEYHKLARKLKLIPMSAENACGHDFEIRSFECGTGSGVQQKTQIKMLLRKLISDVEEENSRLSNLKLSLEESCEQVNSNIVDKSNDLKQIREQIRKLDEQLDTDMQKLAREEQDWAAEVESAENHLKLLQKKVNDGYDEAVQELKGAQQQYHLVLQETNEERRTVANNLVSVFATAATHLAITEKCLEDLHSRVQRLCSKAIEEDEAEVQNLRELLKSFLSEANCL